MKRIFLLLLIAYPVIGAPFPWNRWFDNHTLRIDLIHVGNATEEWLTVHAWTREPVWAGPVHGRPEPYPVGRYQVTVQDPDTGNTLFSYGLNTMFSEYQTTKDAIQGTRRPFEETVRIPWPKRPVRLVVEKRRKDHSRVPILTRMVDPADITIGRFDPPNHVTAIPIVGGGDPHTHMDLVIVAEGYTEKERHDAERDARHFADKLLAMAPYHRFRDRITITLAFTPSQQSGCTMPTRGIYKRTTVGASFNSLGLPRYLLTEHHFAFRDIAGVVPYDIGVIMVNSDRYGGGGIYNFYCVFTAKNRDRDYLFLHEFGHAFAGLADEYYSSDVTYSDFYPKGVEPLEPNITALADPARLKWRTLVTPGTPIPTPWNKALYDRKNAAHQRARARLNRKIARLTRTHGDRDAIQQARQELTKRVLQHDQWTRHFFATHPMAGKVGAFEGAGYSSKGLYRPMLDCIMFSRGEKPFCRVCEAAVAARLRWFTE